MTRALLDGLAALLVALALFLAYSPAPLPRPDPDAQPAHRDLVGKWKVQWGTVRCVIHLRRDGHYTCDWPGATYTGTWGLDAGGNFWITESCHPQVPSSWTSYELKLRGSRRRGYLGPILSGAQGVDVSLKSPE